MLANGKGRWGNRKTMCPYSASSQNPGPNIKALESSVTNLTNLVFLPDFLDGKYSQQSSSDQQALLGQKAKESLVGLHCCGLLSGCSSFAKRLQLFIPFSMVSLAIMPDSNRTLKPKREERNLLVLLQRVSKGHAGPK